MPLGPKMAPPGVGGGGGGHVLHGLILDSPKGDNQDVFKS